MMSVLIMLNHFWLSYWNLLVLKL